MRLGCSNTFKDQAAHKYMVDVDGHSFSTRFKNLLLTNSLVFKQASPYKEWYLIACSPDIDLRCSSIGSIIVVIVVVVVVKEMASRGWLCYHHPVS